MVSQKNVWGAIALGVFSVALSVMFAVLLVACGGGTRSSPDVQSVENTSPAPVTDTAPPADRSTEAVGPDTGEDDGGDPPDAGDYVWWVDPETGQEGWIVEGYASIGLEYFPEWVFDPPLQSPKLPDRIDYELALSLGGQ